MSAKDRAKGGARRAGDAADAVRSNPYVTRLIEDGDLRDNLRQAYESAKGAYGRLGNGKGPTRALFDDKKVQRDLKTAVDSLREASEQLRSKPKPSRVPKVIAVGVVGAGLALVVSEGARKKVLDTLFGAEEEFEYTSTTTPAPPAPETSKPAS